MFGSGKSNDQQIFVRILVFRRASSVRLSHLFRLEVSSNLDSPTPNWLIWLAPTFSTILPSMLSLSPTLVPLLDLKASQNLVSGSILKASQNLVSKSNQMKGRRKMNCPKNRSQLTLYMENSWKTRRRHTPFSESFRKRSSLVKVFLEVQRQQNKNLR